MIAAGESPKMAEMLAARMPPGTKGTNRTFLQGSHNPCPGLDDRETSLYVAMAKKAGIDVAGKIYKGSMAKVGLGPLDPRAWVSGTEDVLATCKARGEWCRGAVNYTPPQKPPPPDIPLAEDIVRREVANEAMAAKAVGKKPDLRALREKVIAEKGARKKTPATRRVPARTRYD